MELAVPDGKLGVPTRRPADPAWPASTITAVPSRKVSSESPFWREALAPYAQPSIGRSVLDLATSVVPYLVLSVAMYLALDDTGRAHLVANIVGSMTEPMMGMEDDAKRHEIQQRMLKHYLLQDGLRTIPADFTEYLAFITRVLEENQRKGGIAMKFEAAYFRSLRFGDPSRQAAAANRPWDALVRDILSADGADPRQRPAAKFILDRDADPNLLTRDISRLFLGTNLQCCQCHDHPRIDDYKQAHYYGLFAFLSRSSIVVDPKLKQAALSEKADGEVTFQSVFDPAKVTKNTGPRLPEAALLKEPAIEKGKAYLVAPAPGIRAVPRFGRRALLGPALARADNEAFKRNMANRLWALMMGRGLVHPLDLDHSANPPSHPELLTMLANDLAARKFDMRGFLRELALSQTYQRSSEQPSPGKGAAPTRYTVALLKPMTPEQLAWSLMQATGLTDAERQALGKNATEAALHARLAANVAPFVKTFGSPPGQAQEFDARLDQALFLANGPTVRGWLTPRPGNLIERLTQLTNADALADELYLSVFTRLPGAEERKEVTDFLVGRSQDRTTALQDMAWALLASAEFRFNH